MDSINATLTLPGIAGIVLTMAIVVDTNVIIYERTKEELFVGKSIKQVYTDGFKHITFCNYRWSPYFIANSISIIYLRNRTY